jgi:hypothetical protein
VHSALVAFDNDGHVSFNNSLDLLPNLELVVSSHLSSNLIKAPKTSLVQVSFFQVGRLERTRVRLDEVQVDIANSLIAILLFRSKF